MKKQVHVVYSGRVQGVGFRWTAQNIAQAMGIAGRVKNLSNGGVEIVAEAEEDTLKDYLSRIEGNFDSYIEHKDIRWQEAGGYLNDFKVEF